MTSAGVPKLGKASIIFVVQEVIINYHYYRDHILGVISEEMREMLDVNYIFLQDGACAHSPKERWNILINSTLVTFLPIFGFHISPI